MKYRDIITRKLENLEGTLRVLDTIVKRQSPIAEYKANISKMNDLLEEVKSYIEAEPKSVGEINKR